jgi:hypothetical protein
MEEREKTTTAARCTRSPTPSPRLCAGAGAHLGAVQKLAQKVAVPVNAMAAWTAADFCRFGLINKKTRPSCDGLVAADFKLNQ